MIQAAIVTGANGFVGKKVCQELMAQKIHVTAVVRRGAEHLDGLEGAQIVEADLAEYSQLDTLLQGRNADVFFHFAWTGSAGALRADERIQLANVQSSCDAVKAAAALGVKRFLFASSIMEYEVSKQMQTVNPPALSTIYSTAKITANYMARAIAANCGISFIPCVISNIYGPGETSPRLINTSIRKMLRGEHASFSSGEQLYDFIYATDAARLFVAIAQSGLAGKTYYIGNPTVKPLKEFLLEMRDVVAPGVTLGLGDFPFTGVSLSYREIDTTAAYMDTDFVIQVPFSQGIAQTAQWIAQKEGIK